MPRAFGNILLRPAPGRVSRGRVAAVLAAFLAGYFLLRVPSATERSATVDEPIHLTAGYLALAASDYRLDVTHPPLLRMWAALPLLGRPAHEPATDRIGQWKEAGWYEQAYDFANDFLYATPEADAWLNRARMMMLLLGALLGVLLFCWIFECLGFVPAGLGLLLYLIEPNLAAHTALVTTDLGITCFFFGACYLLWRTLRKGTVGNLAGLAGFVALAVVSKFSALLLGPAILLVGAVAVWSGVWTLRRAAMTAVVVSAVSWLSVWAIYGFRYAPAAGVEWQAPEQQLAELRQDLPLAGRLIGWIDRHKLLPAAYTQGLGVCFTSAEKLPGYLAGEISTTGWWYFYPFAFLVKTPVSLLLLALTGTFCLIGRRTTPGFTTVACLLLPPAVYLAVAIGTDINLGLRHILPVYPVVLMLGAHGTALILAAECRRTTKWLLLGPVLTWGVVVFARTYPSNLTFFNQLVGGPAQGAHYLVDSNLDWGQHLKLLKRWMDQQGADSINLAYFGSVDPDYYGLTNVPLPGSVDFGTDGGAPPKLPGYVAISATVLSGVYFQPEWRWFYRGFSRLEPVAVIGNTINVYWVERWPFAVAPRGAPDEEIEQHQLLGRALARLGWDDHAIIHFRRYLRRHPDDSSMLLRLGRVLLRNSRTDEALPLLQRSVALNPNEAAGEGSGALASILLDQQDIGGALPHARTFSRLQPGNAQAHDLLGVVLACDNQLAAAVVAFRRALELAPSDATIRGHLELARRMLGENAGPSR